MQEYNSEAFTPEQVNCGAHMKLINTLLDFDRSDSNKFHDIHITSDGYCLIIEWCDNYYHEQSDSFTFLPYDARVMRELELPDNSIVMVNDQEEADEVLKDWLAEHPTWKKNDFGHWYDEVENERLKKELNID